MDIDIRGIDENNGALFCSKEIYRPLCLMVDFLVKNYYWTNLEYAGPTEETVLSLQRTFQKHANPPVPIHRTEISVLYIGLEELVNYIEIPGVSEQERKRITKEIRNSDNWSFVKELIDNSNAELLGDDD